MFGFLKLEESNCLVRGAVNEWTETLRDYSFLSTKYEDVGVLRNRPSTSMVSQSTIVCNRNSSNRVFCAGAILLSIEGGIFQKVENLI